MIIAFDIGNSFIKWKIVSHIDNVCIERNSCKLESLAENLQHLSMQRFKKAVFSNVAIKEHVNAIQKLITAEQWYPVKSCKNMLGVTNAYAEPELLGVDRWLTAVEAYNRYQNRAVMVVDAGTAITIDVVDENGVHQGGFIVPSAHLMQQSLATGTARVRVNQNNCQDAYGKDTNCAVKAGLARMMRAWLREELEQFNCQFPRGVILFTGGARLDLMLEQDLISFQFEEDLLLDGLLRVAKTQR